MADGPKSDKSTRSEERQKRLAAELRANIPKRKAQARARDQAESARMHQGAHNPTKSEA